MLCLILQEDGQLSQEVPESWNGFAYVYRGGCKFGEPAAVGVVVALRSLGHVHAYDVY